MYSTSHTASVFALSLFTHHRCRLIEWTDCELNTVSSTLSISLMSSH